MENSDRIFHAKRGATNQFRATYKETKTKLENVEQGIDPHELVNFENSRRLGESFASVFDVFLMSCMGTGRDFYEALEEMKVRSNGQADSSPVRVYRHHDGQDVSIYTPDESVEPADAIKTLLEGAEAVLRERRSTQGATRYGGENDMPVTLLCASPKFSASVNFDTGRHIAGRREPASVTITTARNRDATQSVVKFGAPSRGIPAAPSDEFCRLAEYIRERGEEYFVSLD